MEILPCGYSWPDEKRKVQGNHSNVPHPFTWRKILQSYPFFFFFLFLSLLLVWWEYPCFLKWLTDWLIDWLIDLTGRAWVGGGAEEKERISSRLPTESRASFKAGSHDPETMTWAEIKSQAFNQLSHPGPLRISTSQIRFKKHKMENGKAK